jgi:hypothetical protein
MAAMGVLMQEMTAAGTLIATEGLRPSSLGAKVKILDGHFSVLDGPFPERTGLIGGYALVRANSKAEAIGVARRFLGIVGEGEVEIREIFDPSNCASHEELLTPELSRA